jgi:hypothetical protein
MQSIIAIRHLARLCQRGSFSAHAPPPLFFSFSLWKHVVLLAYFLFFAKIGDRDKTLKETGKLALSYTSCCWLTRPS